MYSRLKLALARLPIHATLVLPLWAFGLFIWIVSRVARGSLAELLSEDQKLMLVFRNEGVTNLIYNSCDLAEYVALIFAGLGLLGLLRTKTTLFLIRQSYILIYDTTIYYTWVVCSTLATLSSTQVAVDGLVPSGDRIFFWFLKYTVLFAILMPFVARLHLNAYTREAINAYTRSKDSLPVFGDHWIAVLRYQLRQRSTRGTAYSVSLHLFILLAPILWQLLGAVTPYLVPQGKGLPDAGGGAVKKTAQEKGQKKLAKVKVIKKRNPKAKGVYFDADAGKNETSDARAEAMMEELDKLTSVTYKANQNIVIGGQGTGTGGGKGPGDKAGGIGKGGVGKGGWPDGMANGLVRFVRLEYSGPDWDDGMSVNDNADVNFLEAFKQDTGFKVAARGESHPIRFLAKYEKGFAPPFVYMTGSDQINVPPSDMKILRDYCLDGGMLFADCGSPEWHRAFLSFVSNAFPGKNLVDVADDDEIYQAPYPFPNGAPPLWHHGGNRAKGIKQNGRWMVYYFPGDMNDAWKTGHSGLDAELSKGAFQLGTNIIYYSFTHYLEETKKYRKQD